MKLRSKFFIIFFLIAAVPILLISSVAYYRYYTTTQNQMDEYSANIFGKAVQQTNDALEDVRRAADLFTFYSNGNNSLIQNLKPYAGEDADTSPLAIYQTKQNMKYLCSNILNTYDFIYGLYIFTPSGVTFNYDGNSRSKLLYQYDPAEEDWFQEAFALKGQLYISNISSHDTMFTGGEDSVFFAKYLYDIYSHKYLGVLLMNCSPEIFDLSNLNALPDIVTFELKNTDTQDTVYSSNTDNGQGDFLKHSTQTMSAGIRDSSLELTAAINYDRLSREFNLTGLILIALALTSLLISLVLAYVLSHYLTQPIIHLSHIMSRQEGSGLIPAYEYPDRTDEVGTLYNEYNNMAEKLNTYIKNEYQNKLITLDAQMKSLEARINSHFLFNTLASISSIAEIDGSERLSTMSISLGNMFRYAIKTKSELVTIRDELNHVNDYIMIQSIRFDNAFRFTVNLPESMMSLNVLKLILQPLVENAIIHGLQNCQAGSLIEITGSLKPPFILLTVADDGQGMTGSQLDALLGSLKEEAAFTELGHRSNSGIGIKNIDSRIRLYYGDSYGLSIDSSPGHGTSITIKLPILEGK